MCMPRKGELSPAAIDRGWPYQVARRGPQQGGEQDCQSAGETRSNTHRLHCSATRYFDIRHTTARRTKFPHARAREDSRAFSPQMSSAALLACWPDLDAAKGSLTGAQGGNRNYQVKTPYGTLGFAVEAQDFEKDSAAS
jgi:hypothetical protein